ncbi:unnamed protein product [marine sediment metagenome]|uniref:Uncharacterized protein n=1 Tax=marine sediment metagenome TaxID=412755 RepID=X0ZI98_9ZZZZ
MPLPDSDQTINWNTQPIRLNIRISKNTTFWWKGHLTYTNEDGVTADIDLSDATVKKFCLESPGGTDTLIELTNLTATGKFEILIQPADIAALDEQDYRYDCDIVLPAGNATFPAGASMSIFEGIATVSADISA